MQVYGDYSFKYLSIVKKFLKTYNFDYWSMNNCIFYFILEIYSRIYLLTNYYYEHLALLNGSKGICWKWGLKSVLLAILVGTFKI